MEIEFDFYKLPNNKYDFLTSYNLVGNNEFIQLI